VSATSRASANSQAEFGFGMLGTMPLMILGIEAVIGVILLGLGMIFMVTIFLGFVALVLWYAGLWIAVVLSTLGASVSVVTLLAGRRYVTGKSLGAVGLLIHLLIVAAAGHYLFRIHNSGAIPPANPAPALAPGEQAPVMIEQPAANARAAQDFAIPEPEDNPRPAADPLPPLD
jgi:hypothetical protein